LLLRRTLGASALTLALATGVVLITDESHSTAGMRLARLCALSPALAVLAQAAIVALARHRGELLALESLGASPWLAARGAMLGSWLVGAVAIGLLLTPFSDVRSLFPVPPVSSAWFRDGLLMLSPDHGLRVQTDGTIGFLSLADEAGVVPGPGRLEALCVVLPAVLVLPPWQLLPEHRVAKVVAVALTLAASLLVLHGAAAHRLATALLPLAILPILLQLLGHALRSRQQLRWFRSILGQQP
jgi:hypothetical protein